ncbi:LGFP repeat-containing protein [Tenacibaculum sp. TC6]|uniref:LGFP repeat-containing protein n=1 Tax=Tenacibaculum sp. TC6 TaxID=3423223 RepID=UPI003D364B4C
MQNKVSYSSVMNIVDHETFGSNEKKTVINSGVFLLDKSKKTNSLFFVGKCGGEVRIELKIEFTQNSNGTLSIKESAKLFEGASTNSKDLDGTASKSVTIGKNENKSVSFRVRNTDEGGDYADIILQVSNVVIDEADCTNSIKAKAQELGTAFTGSSTSDINNPTSVKGGKRVTFQKCDIYCSPQTGPHEIHGAIRQKYNTVGGPNNDLSLPVSDETTTPDGKGRYNHFIGNGSIYWHPTTGPKLVRGGIRHTWAKAGWEKGVYGYPTSDEIKIDPNKAEWFGDFQSGVIYWEKDKSVETHTASLSGSKVRAMFEKIFKDKAKSQKDLNIESVHISEVSDTGYDFVRSKNRKVSFKISGNYESGVFFIPNPSYTITLKIAFESDKNPDGKVGCKLKARLDHWHIHTSGVGHEKLFNGLKKAVLEGFDKPFELGEVPQNTGFLSFKVMKDGGIKLYFKGDTLGKVVALVAQDKLDKL